MSLPGHKQTYVDAVGEDGEWVCESDCPKCHPNKGACYYVAEAFYHILGGRDAGWTPQVVRVNGETHWFLEHSSGFIFDPTASQYADVPYDEAVGRGFLTAEPSKRARAFLASIGR